MKYELNYDSETGKVSGIRRLPDGAFIPLAPDNSDFQQFLAWNAQQAEPLDLDSTIPVVINYSISPSIIIIPADGVTSADLSVVSDPADATAELLYAGLPLSIPLVDGRGSIPITSSIPGILLITGVSGGLADCKTYVYAGQEVLNG